MFQQAVVAFRGDDQVVQHLDAQDVSRLFQPFRDVQVFRGGIERCRGMVVGDDDRRGPVLERRCEDFDLCVASGTIKLLLLGIENSCII